MEEQFLKFPSNELLEFCSCGSHKNTLAPSTSSCKKLDGVPFKARKILNGVFHLGSYRTKITKTLIALIELLAKAGLNHRLT